MSKILKFDSEAREKLLKGINTLTDAVATTLGPKGRNVAIDKKWGAPNVVHDGVTVAKEIDLEDPFENMGAQLLKEAASKTADVAGDGTTTATILAKAIVTESLKNIQAGSNPMILKHGIEKAVTALVTELKKMSKKISTEEEVAQVATISASDSQIGNLIAASLQKVGKDGVVTVEEGKTMEMSVDYKEGMEFDKGYVSPYFVTDTDKMEASIEDAHILITDKKISSAADLVPFLEKFVQVSKNLVIIADEVEGEALALLVVNKLRSTFNVLALKAPGFGDRRKEMLEDIAILTGGSVLSEDTGRKLESVEIADLGRAGRVTSDKDNTLIVDGKGVKAKIEARVAQIRRELDKSDSEFDKEKLQERLAKLTGGVAVINVGAATEVELKEKKERVIDAVAATKAAIAEGIVAGGEVALLRAGKALDVIVAEGEEKIGIEIVKRSLEHPFRKLIQNAGMDEGIALSRIMAQSGNMGIDVLDGEIKDLVKAGIIDPVKVTRSALQNAASVAVMVMTTNCLITDLPEKTPPAPPMPGGMGGMPDY
ncbi:MAG: 60 kDa chaperonin [Candidatus Daviesbacteria bacterium GW2011_GWB1_39_5]|uniref:Chaperonin GroEL n=1 Tax=Candidatus Daviesbacteria bacterium GW2011_GWC2_40_12 TaxID=1618431 RepID=A0A0G0QPH8_9BACT|nr:MAG: 60 kDa chaperonin [Candidatus Daviesbacteria bacterium GW2011_GWA2_39_33]KKR25369.1 MAG: 60 kDa chaperonin [Candidatus Daviesbacteria bacterium GW2011_GWB1_39_5]KKR42023.1 MAG: 60 kDa chaperonin [Candidatus Daviesbacteria bacterium GW2011_GWC2_40_12]OGE20791.1 MAG: chaperonin GroL [Candidatus Daviesbacteria bacterium RIFCSPHIGHO2_01_FULL_40_24]OGE28561.1 MAG: chaperonin GroL [Candidatus Daviesbacteria bacterium RIFCSPHIGHO2_02_FULL_40_16]OGE41764.1 MAG: chaperonin GroL [Candidatus Davi